MCLLVFVINFFKGGFSDILGFVLCFDGDVVLVCTEPFTGVSLEGTMEEMSVGSEDN